MQLKQAIQRAVRFAAKDSAEVAPAFKCLRFLPPALPDDVPRLFATNGVLGIILTLDKDIEVQNAACSAKLCSVMARESEAVLSMEWQGKGLEFKTRHKSSPSVQTFRLPAESLSEFPSWEVPPAAMEYIAPTSWRSVLAVANCASGPKVDDQVFRCVRFTPKFVEATDRFRVARADIDAEWEGLVPCELFQNFPKGDVFTKFTALVAFFRVDEETRYAVLMHGKFPDTRSVVQEQHRGHFAKLPVKPLAAAVSQASRMTKFATVRLAFEGSVVQVSSWTADPREQYSSSLVAPGAVKGGLLVNGKFLLEALQSLDTPMVLVGYGDDPKDLLRLESGRLTMSLWPWVEERKEEPT